MKTLKVLAASAGLATLMAFGCGSKDSTVRVWGTVTYRGKPVEDGEILFSPLPDTMAPSTGGMIHQGHYDVPPTVCPVLGGNYRVEIRAMVKTGRKVTNVLNPKGPPVNAYANLIPSEFNAKSKLTVTISPESSEKALDFHLPAQ